MLVPLSLVVRVIEQHQLNTVAVYDTAERLRLYFAEGDTADIVEQLRAVHRDLTGTYLLKAWKRTPAKAGRPKSEEGTYSWHVRGAGGQADHQPIGAALPEAMAMELATLRAEKELRQRQAYEDEEEDEDEPTDDGALGKLVELLAGLIRPAQVEQPPAPVAGAVERGHPSALSRERMERILRAIKVAHASDPAQFAAMEQMLLQQYGRTEASNG